MTANRFAYVPRPLRIHPVDAERMVRNYEVRVEAEEAAARTAQANRIAVNRRLAAFRAEMAAYDAGLHPAVRAYLAGGFLAVRGTVARDRWVTGQILRRAKYYMAIGPAMGLTVREALRYASCDEPWILAELGLTPTPGAA